MSAELEPFGRGRRGAAGGRVGPTPRSDRHVGDPSSATVDARRRCETGCIQPLARPVPVDRDDIARRRHPPRSPRRPASHGCARCAAARAGGCRQRSSSGTADTTSESPSRSRTRPQRIRHESITASASSVLAGAKQAHLREHVEDVEGVVRHARRRRASRRATARRRRGAAGGTAPRASAQVSPDGTASASELPSQYASTTSAASGSAIPLPRAIRRRYGHAPSNFREQSRSALRSCPTGRLG